MVEPFIGEIRMFAIGYAPRGWMPCNGQLLQINQNQALYAIIGVQFGGDGRSTFALPNLQGRAPLMQSDYKVGNANGEEAHIVTVPEMPQHTHVASAGTTNDGGTAAGHFWGGGQPINDYETTANVQMNAAALGLTGASHPHSNMQPYLTLQFCIAVQGIFPSRG